MANDFLQTSINKKGGPEPAFVCLAAASRSIAIVIRLERTFCRNAEVFGLVGGELSELDAEVGEVQAGHFFIEFLRKDINLLVIFALVLPERQLCQDLIGE